MSLSDSSLMPFGKYKGVKLINVPASYLIWLYENGTALNQDIREYIKENLDVLKAEIKK